MGAGSTHKPFFASRASYSSPSSPVFPGAYTAQALINVDAIRQEHIGKGATVAILPVAAVLWGHGISRFCRQENPHPIWYTGGVKWSRTHFHEFVARC
jgi:hypothetical protein